MKTNNKLKTTWCISSLISSQTNVLQEPCCVVTDMVPFELSVFVELYTSRVCDSHLVHQVAWVHRLTARRAQSLLWIIPPWCAYSTVKNGQKPSHSINWETEEKNGPVESWANRDRGYRQLFPKTSEGRTAGLLSEVPMFTRKTVVVENGAGEPWRMKCTVVWIRFNYKLRPVPVAVFRKAWF